jgi:DinB superfamily
MSEADPALLTAEFERVRADFQHLIALAGENDWAKPTLGTRWTNEQLLFHMVFGYMVVRRLLILVRLFGRLPDPLSRGFARLLDSATRPFDLINYYGSCLAATVYNRRRMAAKLNRTIDSLERSLRRQPPHAFRRGMHYRVHWDPYFREYMTLADIYRYPGLHYDHHRQQLTLSNLG